MAGDSVGVVEDQYSRLVGFIYVFNLIVGTGALTMPAAVQQAGWLLSSVVVVVLAFMSYMTLTFMTETMAISNAKFRFQKIVLRQSAENLSSSHSVNLNERQHLLSHDNKKDKELAIGESAFEISHRVEMGVMATLYYNKVGLACFNLCMIIYLYGDLAIYAAAVPKSMRDVVCTYTKNDSHLHNRTALHDGDPCWPGLDSIDRMDAYRIFVAVFALLIGPFAFFNAQKTKYLQVMTSLARWISFILMVILGALWLGKGKGTGDPPVAKLSGMPNLFGVCIYSFMCHHSLPSMITPIKNKSKLLGLLAGNYVLILVFYVVLAFTAIFAIADVEDLYTLNFRPHDDKSLTNIVPFQYFLALFPVFTLSTNFPIITVTLRNNFVAFFTMLLSRELSRTFRKVFCPLLAILPPFAIAMATNKVGFLVGITGSYAGAGIQYAIPATLVYFARKDILAIGRDYKHQSPFRHNFWVIATLTWTVVCVGFVTVNHILEGN